MSKKDINRYQFLKQVGFTGPALMAALSACSQKEDYFIESLILNKNGETVASLDSTSKSAAASSGGSSSNGGSSNTGGSTSGGSGGTTTTLPAGTVSTADLAKITSPLAKIDLTSTSAKSLASAGGYVIVSNMFVVGRTSDGNYVAATNLCTHEPKRRVVFNKTEFYCTDHGARFALNGSNLNTIARSPLLIYNTANDGKTLVIY
ncbi:Rieske 2Fe-2S domain-containing protein [Aquirufa sp. ROCK-SH2]